MDRAQFAAISPLLDVDPAPVAPSRDEALYRTVVTLPGGRRLALSVVAVPWSNLRQGAPRSTGADVAYSLRLIRGAKDAQPRILGTFPRLDTATAAADAIASDPRMVAGIR